MRLNDHPDLVSKILYVRLKNGKFEEEKNLNPNWQLRSNPLLKNGIAKFVGKLPHQF